MPRASHYMEARLNDPEYAAAIVDASDSAPARRWRPRPAEWSTELELLADQYDRIGHLITQQANLNRQRGRSPARPPSPFPRPVTAIERAQAATRDAHHDQILSDVEAAQQRWLDEEQHAGG